HVMGVGNFVHQQVVDKCSARSHQTGILNLSVDQFGGVVAADPLHQGLRAGARDFEFAHVAHVEKSGVGAHRFVFGEDSRIFHRHVPTAEINHAGVQAPVHGVEGG